MPTPGNLIHQSSTTTGTGVLTLASVNGRRDFTEEFATGGSDTFDYFISHQTAQEWERGTGSIATGGVMVRDSVIQSSNADAAVSFGAGTKDVSNDVPAALQARFVAAQTDNAIVRGDGTRGQVQTTTVIIDDTTNDTDFITGDIKTGAQIIIDVDGSDIAGDGSILLGAGSDAGIYWDGSDLVLDASSAVAGVNIVGPAAAPGHLTLQTEETTVVANDELGRIDFQSPLATGGTDSIAVAASIVAIAGDTFTASVNDTDLVFMTGVSEAAVERLRLDADGPNIPSGDDYSIAGTSVLSATVLGTGVLTSSLKALGTVTAGVWTGTDVAVADGGTGSSTATGGLSNLGGETADADILKADVGDVLTAGYSSDIDADGTVTSGTYTPAVGTNAENLKSLTNGGAFTLGVPSTEGTIIVQMTNATSGAGAITTSSYEAVTGDALTTTASEDFLLYITRVGSTFAHLHVVALQ